MPRLGSNSTDWFPGKRDEQLAMGQKWVPTITAQKTKWEIPDSMIQTLAGLVNAAADALKTCKDEETRTRPTTQKCQDAFDKMEACMRDLKARKFFMPPLTSEEWVALGLKIRDEVETETPPPSAQPEGELTFPGVHLVRVVQKRKVKPEDRRMEYGVSISYGLSGTPFGKYKYRLTAEPLTGADLPYTLFTRRKHDTFDFEGDSGNTVYFCMRYENAKGEPGPYGPIFKASIP